MLHRLPLARSMATYVDAPVPPSRKRRSRVVRLRQSVLAALQRGACCGSKMVERNEAALAEPITPDIVKQQVHTRQQRVETASASIQVDIQPTLCDASCQTEMFDDSTVGQDTTTASSSEAAAPPVPGAAIPRDYVSCYYPEGDTWWAGGTSPFPNLPEVRDTIQAYLEGGDLIEWLEVTGGEGHDAAAMSRAVGVVLQSARRVYESRCSALLGQMQAGFGGKVHVGSTGPLGRLCKYAAGELMRANWPESVLLGEGQEAVFEEEVVAVIRSDLAAAPGLGCFAQQGALLLSTVAHHVMWVVSACALSGPPLPLPLEEVGSRQRYDPSRHRIMEDERPRRGADGEVWVRVVFPAVPDLFETSLCLLEQGP